MNKGNLQKRMKLFGTIMILTFCMQIQAQNDQVTLEPMGKEEFSVRSLNGIPYTVVIEESNTDGQYHLGSTGYLTFKVEDMIRKRSTLRIVLEEEIHASLENKLVKQYRTDVDWIKALLDIKEDSEFKVFPSRPIFSDAGLEKLKGAVFEYADTDKKEEHFYKWIEKINYSVGAVRFFRELYAASNGEDNDQRYNFLPINIYEELHKKR